MAREIKFRAWNKNLREYIDIKNIVIDPVNGDVIDVGGYELLEVNHEAILEQYTGLKDNNGSEIYEGDILRNSDEGFIIGNVEMTQYAQWECAGDYIFDAADSDIVGNIHENPELLLEE